jgi:hypothetical protein
VEKRLASRVKEALEYPVVPKSHGRLIIKGVEFQTMGLISFISIVPIEVEIMQSLPELELKFLTPDSNLSPVPEVVMLTSEQLEFFLSIKNISNEALGRFSIDCRPEVATFYQVDLNYLQTLPPSTEFLLPVILNACEKDTTVKFTINYSNTEGVISLNTSLELKMKVKEGIEVQETSIEPHFKFPWQRQLRDINPSMSEKCHTFLKRAEDLGINDSPYCKVKLVLFNKCKDKLLIRGCVKDANKFKEIIIEPQTTSTIQLKLSRVANPCEKYLADNISIQWTSMANNRRGDLTNFKFKPEEIVFVKEPKVAFQVHIEKINSFFQANVKLGSGEILKGMNLFLYPGKVNGESFKMVPHDLILSGCLSLNIGDLAAVYRLKYLPTGNGDFRMVLGVGNKNRVFYWSYKCWKLNEINVS